MPSPCVNIPLHIKPDGSLEIQGLVSSIWPYSAAISTANGAHVDPVTGNFWAPPETGAASWYSSAVGPVGPSDGGNDRSGVFTSDIAATPSVSITNNDVNRPALVIFHVILDFDASVYGNTICSVRYNLNIPSGTTYVGSTSQSNQYYSHSNSEGVGIHKSSSFTYGYILGANATMTYNVSALYQLSAIANASQLVTLSMAGRAYVVHN